MSDEATRRASHYDAYYRASDAAVYAEIREEELGEDIGQNNWQTRAELDGFAERLALAPGVRLLDVACGAGGPGLHLARLTGCEVTGVDREGAGLASGRRLAQAAGLERQVRFVRADAARPLPFAAGSFGAVLCLDALTTCRGGPGSSPTGRACSRRAAGCSVTILVTVTGIVGMDNEPAIRSSIGHSEFTPPGEDERLLGAAGLEVLAVGYPDRGRRRGRPPARRPARRARRSAARDRGRRGLRALRALPRHRRGARERAADLALRVPRHEGLTRHCAPTARARPRARRGTPRP